MEHTTPLTTKKEAKAYLKALHDNDLLFHLDDDPADMINTATGNPTFTKEEIPFVKDRINEVYSLLEDPFEYIIELVENDHVTH